MPVFPLRSKYPLVVLHDVLKAETLAELPAMRRYRRELIDQISRGRRKNLRGGFIPTQPVRRQGRMHL